MANVVIFPFMAQGHTIPLLDLSKALSIQNIQVTIITTPSNAISIAKYIARHPMISIAEIPFPKIDGLPEGCENTSQLPSMKFYLPFLYATRQLQKPFKQVLENMMETGSPPTCVFSDFFLGWTLSVCQAFGIPRLVFHGMSVLSMAIAKNVCANAPHLKSVSIFDSLELPGMKLPFTLTTADLPAELISVRNHGDPFSQFSVEIGEADAKSWGVVVNGFEELERSDIPSLESFYINGAKAWCVGPLFLYYKIGRGLLDKSNDRPSMLMQWLRDHVAPDSVIYVAFGTQADVSDAQLDEVAFGLEESGLLFLWMVRSKTWALPNGIDDRIKGKGLMCDNGLIDDEYCLTVQ